MIANFIVAGAARAGTTSLYYYLQQHAEVFMSPIKETNFFAWLTLNDEEQRASALYTKIRRLSDYEELFRDSNGFKLRGEASPAYFFVPGVPSQIQKHIPDVKLIFVLRDPVERAYSNYKKNVRDGFETRDFAQTIRQEMASQQKLPLNGLNYYVRIGFYNAQLSRYLDVFGKNQIHIGFYDDLASAPEVFMKDIFSFLGVTPAFSVNTSVKYNVSGVPKNIPALFKTLNRKIRKTLPQNYRDLLDRKLVNAVPQKTGLPREISGYLRSLYAEDIRALETWTCRDLSHWLAVE